MNPTLQKIIEYLISGGMITLFIEIIRHFSKKKREVAEVANIYKTGEELNITIRANIDKYVEEKTKSLQAQIAELEKTIVQISSKYRNDLEKYMSRIADLEKKFDEQLNRTQQVETELAEEQKSRFTCQEQIKTLQARIILLEPKNQNNANSTTKT